MKKQELESYKKKTREEILIAVNDKKMLVLKMKVEIASSKEKNIKLARNLSRDIARLLTLHREKELAEKLSSAK